MLAGFNFYTQTIHNYGDGSWGNYTYSFTYDNMNRLTDASSTVVPGESYVYNGDGRFVSKNRTGNNITYNYTNADNKIESVTLNGSNYSFAYDTKGNVTNDGLNNALLGNYSFRNLPTTMNNFNYTYNDGGERIKKLETDSARTDYYLRDYLGRELVIYNYETNDAKEVNIFGNGLIGKIEFDSTENRSYYLKDHLGNIRCAVNNEGGLLNAQDYYPYGETIRQFNNTRYMLTEKERDVESGNDYFGARYYNNKLGVWLQVDPLSEKYPGWSPYNYTLCNPLRFIDPNGMQGDEEYDPLGYFMRGLRNLTNQMKMLIWGSTSSYEQSNYGNEVGENYSQKNVDDRLNKYLQQRSEQFSEKIKKTSKKVTLKKVHTASSAMSVVTADLSLATFYAPEVSGGFLFVSNVSGGIALGASTLDYIIEPTNEKFETVLIDAASQVTGFIGARAIRGKYMSPEQVKMVKDIYQSFNNMIWSSATGF